MASSKVRTVQCLPGSNAAGIVRLSGQLPSGLTFGLWVSEDSIVIALPGHALVAARGSLTAEGCRELSVALAECAERMEEWQ